MQMRKRYTPRQSGRTVEPLPPHVYPPIFVYRIHSHSGALLYVGRSATPEVRLCVHRKTGWGSDIAGMSTEGPYTWPEAIAREREVIKAERPQHNRVYLTTHTGAAR